MEIKNNFDHLTSYKIARSSDVVFSEVVTLEEFKKLNIENYTIVSKNDRQIFYKLNKFTVQKNSTIFTNSYFIKNLFYYLKNFGSDLELTLITNQTDLLLDKNLYRLKPQCIKRWFSINLEHEEEGLIPMPLGLSNNYSPKNLLPEDFNNLIQMNKREKVNKMYVNFSKNTNFKERDALYENFKEKEWVIVKNPNLTKAEYFEDLSRHAFALAPWGNGVDTHRIWEALYLGTIPVTKYHHTFSTAKNLPIIFVNDYSEITFNLLNQYLEEFNSKKFNYEILESKYWSNLITKEKKKEEERSSINIEKSQIASSYFLYKYRIKQLFLRYYKILIFYSKKILKVINLD